MHFDSPIRPSCYPLTPHLLVTDGIDTLYRASANNAAVSASHRHWPGGSWSLWGCGGSRRRPCPAAPSPGIPLPSAAPIPPVKRTTRVCQAHGPGSAQHPPLSRGAPAGGLERTHAAPSSPTVPTRPAGAHTTVAVKTGLAAAAVAVQLQSQHRPSAACSPRPSTVCPCSVHGPAPATRLQWAVLEGGGGSGRGGGGTEKDSQPAPQTPTPHPPEQSAVHPLPPPPPHPPHPPPPACLFTGSARSCLRAAARAHCLSLGAIVPSGSPPAVHGTT